MTNELLFYTQIGSILIFITSLFVLYRLLVEKKEATIQFLEKQLEKAKEEKPDVVLKQLSERVQIARDEMERLSKDKEILLGMNEKAVLYIESLRAVISADEALIDLHEKQKEEMHVLYNEHFDSLGKSFLNVIEKMEESSMILVHKDANGVVQKVTITSKEKKE